MVEACRPFSTRGEVCPGRSTTRCGRAASLAAALAKLEELGFVRKIADEPEAWEIRRILKARLPVAELDNLKARMLGAAGRHSHEEKSGESNG